MSSRNNPERVSRFVKILHEQGAAGIAHTAILWVKLMGTDLRLRLLPYPLNRRMLFPRQLRGEAPEDWTPNKENLIMLRRLQSRLRIASRYTLRKDTNCLRRAIVLRRELRRRGLPARLVYGAAPAARGQSDTGGIRAHAWVEIGALRLDSADLLPFSNQDIGNK